MPNMADYYSTDERSAAYEAREGDRGGPGRPSREEIAPPTDAEVEAALLGLSPFMVAGLDRIAEGLRRPPSDDAQAA